MDNAYMESFNGTLRRECLHTPWFVSLADAQQRLDIWRQEYNVSRPHGALKNQTPAELANNYRPKERIEAVKQARKLALQRA